MVWNWCNMRSSNNSLSISDKINKVRHRLDDWFIDVTTDLLLWLIRR